MDKINRLKELINNSNNIVFFGGAGVSTESGIKDYRSKDGLYNTVKEYGVSPERILSRSFFYENPEIFYDFYRKYFIADVKPNITHFKLAELEKQRKLKAVITQNIDGLHQMAGSREVVELHGNAQKFICPECGFLPDNERVINKISASEIPVCEKCNNIIKPLVVLYEEPLYDGVPQKAVNYIKEAELLIVGGTSLAVYPAASFVRFFNGKALIIINKGETQYDSSADLIINDSLGSVFKDI